MIKKILKKPFVKFLLVGGLNTVFGYLMFAVIIYMVKDLYLSVILSNVIAVIFNFNTYGRLVFNSKDYSRVFRFFSVYLLIISTQIISIKLLNHIGISNTYIAAGIVTLPVAVMSFLLMRNFVFHKNTPPHDVEQNGAINQI